MLPANFKLTRRFGKSFTDDFVESGDCKRESSLVLRSAEIFPGFLDLFFPESIHGWQVPCWALSSDRRGVFLDRACCFFCQYGLAPLCYVLNTGVVFFWTGHVVFFVNTG